MNRNTLNTDTSHFSHLEHITNVPLPNLQYMIDRMKELEIEHGQKYRITDYMVHEIMLNRTVARLNRIDKLIDELIDADNVDTEEFDLLFKESLYLSSGKYMEL